MIVFIAENHLQACAGLDVRTYFRKTNLYEHARIHGFIMYEFNLFTYADMYDLFVCVCVSVFVSEHMSEHLVVDMWPRGTTRLPRSRVGLPRGRAEWEAGIAG